MKKLFTTLDAAQKLGISLQGVHYRIKKKQLKSIKQNGKVFVYLDDEQIIHTDKKKETIKIKKNDNEIINVKDEQIKFLQKYIKWIKKQQKLEILRIEKNQKHIIEVFNSEIRLLQKAFNEMRAIYQPKLEQKIQKNNNDTLTLKEFFRIMKEFNKTEQEIKAIIFNAVKNNDKRFVYNKEEKSLIIINANFNDLL